MTQTLSVALPSSTLYVSGTVNGVSTIWTLRENNIWDTVADRAEDDTYLIDLTAISSSGQSTHAVFTLYYGLLQLITDRTQADVDRVLYLSSLFYSDPETGALYFAGTEEELDEWNAGLKGTYNASDLNRVGCAINYIANRLDNQGYSVKVSPKITWQESDIPTESDMEAYLADVQTIRSVLPVPSSTPPVPEDMDGLTYIEANNIEQILLDVDALVTEMINAYFCSDEISCGEV